MKIALLWSRWGPYHSARLKGAIEAAANAGAGVLGIEVAGKDGVYAWDRAEVDTGEQTTIFPERRYEAIPRRTLQEGVTQTLDDSGCDVVAVNGWAVPEARAALAWRGRAQGRRAVLMSETKRDDARRRWWMEWLKRRTVARSDTALVGGRAQAAYLRELGVDPDRIFYGYDAVDNEYFERAARTARRNAVVLRGEYGLPERYFVACTRFLPRKNMDGLLRAYDLYRRGCGTRPWGLVIVGSGVEGSKLRKLEQELGLEGVVWPGFVQYDALPVYYGLASAFIHPARSEAWGLVVNEAAASGLPLLLSRTVGAGHELLRENVNGFRFDPSSIDEMADAMMTLAAMNEDARCDMGNESRRLASHWCPRNFGRQLIKAAMLAVSLPDR